MTDDFVEGLRAVTTRPWLWLTFTASGTMNFAISVFTVLGPVIAARELGGAPAWGLVSVSLGVGSMAGAALAMKWKPRFPLLAGYLLAALLTPAQYIGLATGFLWAASAGAVLTGFGIVFGAILLATAVMRVVPLGQQARVSAVDSFVSDLPIPLGMAIAAPLALGIGDTSVLLACAILLLVGCALPLVSRSVRRHREPAVDDEGASA